MLEPLFRRAVVADIPAIVRLVNAANSGDGNTAGWTNEAHLFHGNRTDEAEVAEVASYYERRGFVRTGKFKSFERKQAREGKKVDGMLLEWMEKTLSVPLVRESRARYIPTLI